MHVPSMKGSGHQLGPSIGDWTAGNNPSGKRAFTVFIDQEQNREF